MNPLIISILILLFASPLVTSAHWIVGYVEDALDGTDPNARTVRIWNPSTSDELFSIIGPTGPSGVSNVYLIDCELFTTPCQIGDQINATLVTDGSGYKARATPNLTVTGAGFDVMPNISMNSPPAIPNLTVDDSLSSPTDEIDLTPANKTTILCTGIIEDLDGITDYSNSTSTFFNGSSFFEDSDDNNYHYTNNSCEVDTSFGTSNQASVNCTHAIEYYSTAGVWNCSINVTDIFNASRDYSDNTTINSLLAIGVDSPVNFGSVAADSVSAEIPIQTTNYGNVFVNLSLKGYGAVEDDNYSMNCTVGNISINETKYNLTDTNPGALSLSEFNQLYKNLSSSPVNEPFDLTLRQNDIINDATKDTYWRVYVPGGITGPCDGNIVFGATQG